MATETKGITVKIDAGLHAQVREYVEAHGMTMGEFVAQALDNELHPKFQMQEANKMAANTRTIAFQVPEDLFQRIKDYLARNNMTQRQFFLGLIKAELDREQNEISDIQAAESAEADSAAPEEAESESEMMEPASEQDRAEAQAAPEAAPEGEPELEEPDFGLTM